MYAQRTSFSEDYTEPQYWTEICLAVKPDGYAACQQCIDEVWCDEDALCWDSHLKKLASCTEVSFESGPIPGYPECPGSPAPAPVSFDIFQEGTTCEDDYSTTGRWDLGEKVTQETCLERCGLWRTCEYVSFKPVAEPCDYIGHGECAPSEQKGTCTSFATCNTVENAAGLTTWKKSIMTSTPAPTSGVNEDEQCEPAKYTPWKNDDGSLKEHYTEHQYWADICLIAMPPGYSGREKCQQCVDEVWCNEDATCWDSRLEKQLPCSDVSLNSEYPTYPQCLGAPAPAPVSFDSLKTGKRCHKKFRTTGEWGDLGQEVTQERCLSLCKEWKSCNYVSFSPSAEPCDYVGHGECATAEQVGTCTSFTACDKKQTSNDQTTWEKVELKDENNQRWCNMKCKKGKCDSSKFVQKKCKLTCSLCDARRLQHAGDELMIVNFV